VLLLGEELAPLAPSDEFFSVTQTCGPVEGSLEGLTDHRTRRHMVALDALVDLLQDVFAFLPGDALHEYSRRCAPFVGVLGRQPTKGSTRSR
jgi:hypothetical protein